MSQDDDSWWSFASKPKKDSRPKIPAYVPPLIDKPGPSVSAPEVAPEAGIEVQESEGVDGNDTIIHKVRKFWGLGEK